MTVVCEIWIKSPATWLERDRSRFCGHQTASPGSLRDSKAMMSNRHTLYQPAFFFEHHRPLICNMLCSSITRRSLYHTHIHANAHSIFPTHARSPYTHTASIYLDNWSVARPQNFGSFCSIFSYTIDSLVDAFLLLLLLLLLHRYHKWIF